MCIRDSIGTITARIERMEEIGNGKRIVTVGHAVRTAVLYKLGLVDITGQRVAGIVGLHVGVDKGQAHVPLADGDGPVSYTHLDVYKRQG